jgi:hypothetical protein
VSSVGKGASWNTVISFVAGMIMQFVPFATELTYRTTHILLVGIAQTVGMGPGRRQRLGLSGT